MHIGQQHLHARERIFTNLEQFPSALPWKRVLDYTMFAVGILQPIALLPQLYEIYIVRQVAGLSVVTFVAFGLCNVLWAIYGAVHRTMPVLISGVLFVFLYAAIVFGILMYS